MLTAKRFFFVLVFLTLLAAGSIAGAFVWGKGQLRSNAENVSQLIAQRDAQRENIITLQQADQQIEQLEEINNLLDRLLPKEKDQETLVADIIYTATAEAGIPFSKVGAFSFSGSGDPSELSGTEKLTDIQNVLAYPFNMQINSISYDTFLKLLDEIETNGRIIQVKQVQIAPSKDEPGELSSVSLSLEAYVKP